MIKAYRSLYKRSREQDVSLVFAHFYAVGGDYDEPWKAIARKTIDGFASWGFTQDRFKVTIHTPVMRQRWRGLRAGVSLPWRRR